MKHQLNDIFKKREGPRHIIIDGADGLGKSTVCNLLSRDLDLPIIKMPDSSEFIKDGTIERVSRFFNEVLIQFSEFDFIMDRGFPSSKVYSNVMKREADLGYLDKIELALDPIVVILTHSLDEGSFRNFRADEVYNQDQLTLVDKEFQRLANELGYILIEVKSKTPASVVEEIISEIRIRDEARNN